MKYWWRNVVKDYLAFSAKERNGLIIMGLLTGAIILFSILYKDQQPAISKDALQQELAQLKIIVDSSQDGKSYQRENTFVDYSQPNLPEKNNPYKGELFTFDPNTLDAAGWKKLGIRDKTISTIPKFLASGYRFKKPDDIKRIYGLSPENAARLIPFIRIEAEEKSGNKTAKNNESIASEPAVISEIKSTRVIDINTADTTAFISLPGIGNKLAARIVNFRQKLGGFSSVAQLGETYGIPDSTFQKIKPRLSCINPTVRKININTADANELRTHPYLKWNIANAIVAYRQQHGDYSSIEDIKKIDIINEELFDKIAPYLTF